MKRLALAIALACALSGSALAGDIHSVGCPAPGETSGPPCREGEMGGGGGLADDGNQGAGGLALLILDLLF